MTWPALLLAAAVALAAAPVHGADIAARVRSAGTLRCGAVERPGVAASQPSGRIEGLAVDLCRAVAIAVLGPRGRIVFRLYTSDQDFDAVRRGADDVSFLTGGEIGDQRLAPWIVPGPVVFVDQAVLMVASGSPVRRVADLTGKTVCLMIGGDAQPALEGAAEHLRLDFARLAFEEEGEMLDAYDGGRCQAVVGEATELAGIRPRLKSRLLDEPLALFPIIAATGTEDARWAALVAWVMDWLVIADTPSGSWGATGPPASPVRGNLPGLRPHWQADIASALGGYAAIVRRDLVEELGLPPGPDAAWPQGLLLVPRVP